MWSPPRPMPVVLNCVISTQGNKLLELLSWCLPLAQTCPPPLPPVPCPSTLPSCSSTWVGPTHRPARLGEQTPRALLGLRGWSPTVSLQNLLTGPWATPASLGSPGVHPGGECGLRGDSLYSFKELVPDCTAATPVPSPPDFPTPSAAPVGLCVFTPCLPRVRMSVVISDLQHLFTGSSAISNPKFPDKCLCKPFGCFFCFVFFFLNWVVL